MAKLWVPCPEGLFSPLRLPSDFGFFISLTKKKTSQHLFNPGSAAGPALVQESRLCLMRLGLCQPRCWEMISKPVALCQGVMDRAGSWRMLVILRHTGWQERWDARILVCKSDLGSSAAGKKKKSACVDMPGTVALLSSASRR